MSVKPSYRIVEDSKTDYFQYYPDPSWTKESFIFSFDYDQQSLEDDEAFQITIFIPHSQEFPCIYIWHGEVNSFTDFLKRAQIGNATYTVKENAPEWTINIIHSNKEVFVVFSILSDDDQRGEMAKFGNKLEFLEWLGKMSEKMKLKFQ